MEMEIEVTELLNICRICLKQLTLERLSIFNNFENQITNDHFNQNDDDKLLRVMDIIAFCASNISVSK